MSNGQENIRLAFELHIPKGYVEPQSAAALARRLSSGGSYAGAVMQVAIDAIARVEALEAALLPFAVSGGTALHVRRLLNADDRPNEPSIGIWFTTDETELQMIAREEQFLNAVNSFGRERIKQVILADLKIYQTTLAAVAERSTHEAAGGRIQ